MNRLLWIAMLGAIVLSGCGATREAAKRVKLGNDLKMLGLAYHNFHDLNQKGPSGWQDLQKMEGMKEVQQELEAAGYVVVWGIQVSEVTLSNTIVAYPPNAAAEGGMVLFLDGSMRRLTGPEAAEALKHAPPT